MNHHMLGIAPELVPRLLAPNEPEIEDIVDIGFEIDRDRRIERAARFPGRALAFGTLELFATGVKKDYVPADKAYLTQLVAAGAGLSQADAEKRVDEVTAQAKADADTVRKAGAYLSIFTGVSMLIGAFIAAAAAALGGRHRDEPWRIPSI
jgi:hypothetical protein